MNSPQSVFRTPIPTEPRVSLNLPCTLQVLDTIFKADVFNVSYSGIGVVIGEDQSTFSWKTLSAISVPDLGEFEVSIRWRKGNRLGLKFKSKPTARPLLSAYFEKTGNYPV